MNIDEFKISFRARHPTMVPSLIENSFELIAKYKWMAGDAIVTPNGIKLPNTHNETYCCFPIDSGEFTISNLLENLNERLLIKKEFWRSFVESDGSLEYYLSIYADSNMCGHEFSASLLSDMAKLKIKLSIEVHMV